MNTWKSTATQYLIQHAPSGTFYVRIKVKGRIVRQSLRTTTMSVAKSRLPDKVKEIRYCLDAPPTDNVETMGDCLDLVTDLAKHKTGPRERSRDYREFTVGRVEVTWKELRSLKPKDVTARDCDEWFREISKKYSPALANNMLGTLRMAFKFAKKAGLLFRDPSEDVKRVRARAKNLLLPSPKQFKEFVSAIRHPKGVKKRSWKSGACSDLVEFLAYSGARLDEAANVDVGVLLLHSADPLVVRFNSDLRDFLLPLHPPLILILILCPLAGA